ncbi:MAG: hypothetical protein M1833_000056 [Piccolia ochrophora]|nr:MAG: hypothetical protein M1833_000056 [Piccolia ochrophora]
MAPTEPVFDRITIPFPTSVAEVEQLVVRLYSPGAPHGQIVAIQETLQKLQRSADGWQLADTLLQNHDEKVRFFGALTFTVKLHSDGGTLDDEAAQQLLERLVTWLLRLISHKEGSLVVKKLCSTLVAYLIRFPKRWSRCVRQLLCSLREAKFMSSDTLERGEPTESLVSGLGISQSRAALWFVRTLVEEAGKIDNNTSNGQDIHGEIMANVDDAAVLMVNALSATSRSHESSHEARSQLEQDSIRSFHSWVVYTQRLQTESPTGPNSLKTLAWEILHRIEQQDLAETIVEVFTDILTTNAGFLSGDAMHFIASFFGSPQAQGHMRTLQAGDADADTIQLGRLLLAFGDANLHHLAQNPGERESQDILSMLHSLLSGNGYPYAEDEICGNALEFWSAFVEYTVDRLFAEGNEVNMPWFSAATKHVSRVIQHCLRKIHMPPRDVYATWDSDSVKGFKDFRKDVVDVLQSSYILLGIDLFRKLTDLTLTSLEKNAWVEIEAALFSMNALADNISEGEEEDATLARLLESPLFQSLANADDMIPDKARQTAINLLGHYAAFCERHVQYLPGVLTFLFRCLEMPALSGSASRSVLSLCRSCRKSLTMEIPALLAQYQVVLVSQDIDGITKERVVAAIASVIQALPREEEKTLHLHELLNFIQRDIISCQSKIADDDIEKAGIFGQTALRSLVSAGKALQELEDVPVDLDSDHPRSTIWDQGAGADIQRRIVTMIETVEVALPRDGEILEAACCVFRTGFAEREPGPFVFPPSVTTSFLLKSTFHTPRLGLVLATACALVSSHTSESSARIDKEATALLRHINGLLDEVGDPSEDGEVAQNCVDFISRLIPRYVNVLLGVEPRSALEHILVFTLRCLRGQEVLPKRAAASFWSAFVTLIDEPPDLQGSIDSIMQHIGPHLAEALIMNIGGEASRSELDTLSEPLKKMVVKQVRSKVWLDAALSQEQFPSTNVTTTEKRAFLQKIIK